MEKYHKNGVRKTHQELMEEYYSQYKHTCKCGHVMAISPKQDRVLCNHCNKYIYRTPELEFRYKLKERVKNV